MRNWLVKLDVAVRELCPIDGVSIGRSHDKSTWKVHFSKDATPEQRAAAMAAIEAFDVDAPGVPASILLWQARAVLMAAGHFKSVDAAIKSIGGAALAAWEYSPYISRNSPLVKQMSGVLGLTSDQVDELFRQANQFAV